MALAIALIYLNSIFLQIFTPYSGQEKKDGRNLLIN